MQYFKGDDLEKKMFAVLTPLLENLSLQKDLFYAGAYEAEPLGDVIYNADLAPLAQAINPDIFRKTFAQIFDAFVVAGTFDSYITVFKKIFGDDVGITFGIPAPGKLTIGIVATGLEVSNFVARYIQNNQYVFDEVIDDVGDNIIFQSVQGFQSQYELEQMLFELVPDGIFTQISLTLGG